MSKFNFILVISLSLCGNLGSAFASKDSVVTQVVPEGTFQLAEKGSLKEFKKKTQNVDLNSQDEEKMTFLMKAALGGNLEVARYLIDRKVDLELQNRVGDTALAVAVGNMQFEVAELLIQSGANVDIPISGESEETLLMRVSVDSLKLAELVIKKDRSLVNKRSIQSETPLMAAARYGSPQSIQLLLKAGADPTLRNKKGQTAKDLARESKNKKALEILEKRK